ncbi:hypothetical protein K2Z83_11250 [Oscillochloris sp. ZM17-4]|uniref:hypothetical protein n=1 Tax=Oscillochloris sp. ZM17-4 TaxID=2866714 RepID=UPI001C72DB36|nr:hypothetical protein [Oscillochloris sp. ZM17-4]MBX0328253.1 hypothetical protein [Oscillochloris sp. ZM17-4]
MSVKSRDPNAPTPLRYEPGGITGFAIGLVGMLMSTIVWVLGARWTVDGLIVMFNAVLRFLNASYQAPIPPHVLVYVILSPMPLIFSVVEWRLPFRRISDEWQFAKPGAWLVWGGVFAFDWYTTYLGLGVDPGEGSVRFMRQIAASTVVRTLVALVLTAGPEWLAREMWAQLRYVFTSKRK